MIYFQPCTFFCICEMHYLNILLKVTVCFFYSLVKLNKYFENFLASFPSDFWDWVSNVKIIKQQQQQQTPANSRRQGERLPCLE